MEPTDDLRAAASTLDAAADEARSVLDELRAHDRPDVWRGRRADRFGADLAERRRQVRLTAEDLEAQAAELRRRAELVALLVGPAP